MNTELIRLKKVSEMTSLSTSTLRKMIKRKELRAVLIGNNYYIRPQDYEDFLLYIELKRRGYTYNLEQLQEAKRLMIKLVKEQELEEYNEIVNKLLNQDNTSVSSKKSEK